MPRRKQQKQNSPRTILLVIALGLAIILPITISLFRMDGSSGKCSNRKLQAYSYCANTNFSTPECQQIRKDCKVVPPMNVGIGRKY